jgi:hypothetical protein
VHVTTRRRSTKSGRPSTARTRGRVRCTFDTLCKLARLYAVRFGAARSRRADRAAGTGRTHRSDLGRRRQHGERWVAPLRATLRRCLGCVKPMPCSLLPAPLPYAPMHRFTIPPCLRHVPSPC